MFVSRQRNPNYAAEIQPAQAKYLQAPKAHNAMDELTGDSGHGSRGHTPKLPSPAVTPEASRRRLVASETAAVNRAKASSREPSPAPSASHRGRRTDPHVGAVPSTFEKTEHEILGLHKDEAKVATLWHQLDFNNNGKVSLAGRNTRPWCCYLVGDFSSLLT